jgi:hypothetical protein
MTTRLRCLFGVKDDLHDYAEAIHARLAEFAQHDSLADLDSAQWACRVVNRTGNLQAELIRINPCEVIPQHIHPHVDSVDLIIAGDIDLVISGKRIAEGYSKDRRSSFLKRAGLRIAANAPHGGSTGPDGVLFISCQKWDVPPSHIALAWAGPSCTAEHARMLETLGRIR